MVGAPETAPGTTGVRSLVLVADDDADTRQLYRFSLSRSGYDVEEAADGREALSKVQALVPGVVVTDLSLPHLDGFSLCREIKQNERTAHVPVIAVTGHSGPACEDEAREAGFEALLLKPVVPDALLAQIQASMAAVRTARERARELRADAASLASETRALRERSAQLLDRARELARDPHRSC